MKLCLSIILCLLGTAKSQELRRLRLPRDNTRLPVPDSREAEGDMLELARLLEHDFSFSMLTPSESPSSQSSPPSTVPTSPAPTSPAPTSPVPTSPVPVCDPACPCCAEGVMPEFARAIEAYSPSMCQPGEDCCLSRKDDGSELLLLAECESSQVPGYNVAYMSYDYGGSRVGCTPGQECKMCGDSAFGDPLWIVLSDTEAQACEAVVRSRIQDPTSCTDTWPCT